MKTWLCHLYIVFFEKEVKLAGVVFWLPLTLRATSENKYSRRQHFLTIFFFKAEHLTN